MATKTQTNIVEQAVEPVKETVKETEAAVGQDSVTIADNPVAEDAPVVNDYVKPTFEFVRVDAFLPVEIVVGQPAYIRVLGEFDTKDMVSTVPVFTQPVTAITDNGFETDDAAYVEVK